MDIRCVGAGHPGVVPPGYRRVPVPLHRYRQIHLVAESDPRGQDQHTVNSPVHQVYHL
jgi:hypothetical protein